MSAEAFAFILILILNFLVTLAYWLFWFVIRKEYEAGFYTRCLVMLLCPVIGPVYFFAGWLLRKLFFHKPVDLTDVIFSKEREKTLLKADEDRESNILPIEEAVAVVDKQNARELMLEVLRYDVKKSLGSLFLALDSDDSEISHYAASVLQSELGKFRLSVQNTVSHIEETESELRELEKYDGELKTPAGEEYSKRLAELSGTPDRESDKDDEEVEGRENPERKFIFADLSEKLEQSEDYDKHETSAHAQGLRAYYGEDVDETTLSDKIKEQAEEAHGLIGSIYRVLKQNVLSELESIRFTELADGMGVLLEKRDTLSKEEMALIAECWRLRKNYEKCAQWCDRLSLVYPKTLEAFSAKLKLLYETDQRSSFLETIDEMKKTGVPLDHEMMEMVRIFM